MSGQHQGHYDEGYSHQPQATDSYYQDEHNQNYYDQHQDYQHGDGQEYGHQQGTAGYYDDS